jgi:IPT/TIG domain
VVRFSYAAVPKVGHLSARGGPTAGGTRLTVTGTGLSSADEVRFIAETAPFDVRVVKRFSSHSATSLSVVTPPGHAGPAAVEPCSASGCARPGAGDTFFYGPSRT